jgi:predicted NBD/HSP70 family sugar kinase
MTMNAPSGASARLRVGLDVGGTKTDAVALDARGVVVARSRRPTAWGVDGVVQTVQDAVADLRRDPAVSPLGVGSVGIGLPGQVAPGGTRVVHAVNLGIAELDLAEAVAAHLGVPVQIENDVKAAALGAYALHGATGAMAYLNLGTGVAAGIVVDGEPWRGSRGAAGEIGHISIDPAGPLCRCGQSGCIEALTGGAALAERWGRGGALPVQDVFDAADAGDDHALRLRGDLAHGVAAAVRVLVLTADVDAVVLGGGLTGLGDRLLSDVSAALVASAAESPFLRSLHLDRRVELLPSGSPAAALGAALVGSKEVVHGG